MKKFFLSLAVLMMGAVSFTSCGDDDDLDDIDPSTVKPICTITEKGNQAIFKAVSKGIGSFTATATFDKENICTSYVEVEEYSSKKMADAVWEEYEAENDDEEMKNYSRKGNSITYVDDSYVGDTKQEILQMFEFMKAEMESDKDFDF